MSQTFDENEMDDKIQLAYFSSVHYMTKFYIYSKITRPDLGLREFMQSVSEHLYDYLLEIDQDLVFEIDEEEKSVSLTANQNLIFTLTEKAEEFERRCLKKIKSGAVEE